MVCYIYMVFLNNQKPTAHRYVFKHPELLNITIKYSSHLIKN